MLYGFIPEDILIIGFLITERIQDWEIIHLLFLYGNWNYDVVLK